MLNRRQFKEHWNQIDPRLAVDDGPLWIPEKYADHKPCRWFVQIRRQDWETPQDKNQFWIWCQQHCAGQILCYSADDDSEWWGFTHQADIALWLLRWS